MRGVVLVSGRLDIFWLNQGFGMNHSTWSDILDWPANPAQSGNFTDLGGVFTSPPVAASMNPDRVDAFGLGSDYALYHRYLQGTAWSAGWESLGGNLTSPPAVIATPDRLDVFVLGTDRAMLQLTWTAGNWGGWQQLGGCFATPPVAIAGPNGRIDLFGRGPDGFLYKNACVGGVWEGWSLLGGPLLGEPIAASMPAAVRSGTNNLDVFVVGSEGAMWHIAWDGIRWHPWELIGTPWWNIQEPGQSPVTFSSEPAAFAERVLNVVLNPPEGTGTAAPASARIVVNNFHTRLDVFVVGPDRIDTTRQDLWRISRDTGTWTFDNPVEGPLSSLPGLALGPQTGPYTAAGPTFLAVSPGLNDRLSTQTFSLTSTTNHPHGPAYSSTNLYRFAMERIFIIDTRALHNDTDLVTAAIAAGRWPIQQLNQNIGDVNSGTHIPDKIVSAILSVEVCDALICNYLIVNSGDSSKAKFIVEGTAKGLEDWINDLLKNTKALQDSLIGASAEATTALAGSLLGAAAAVGIEYLISLAFADCDGIVAAENQPFDGRDLQQRIIAGGGKLTFETSHPGTDSADGCGGNSYYVVTWSLTRV